MALHISQNQVYDMDWSPLLISVKVAFLSTVLAAVFGIGLSYVAMKLRRLRGVVDVVLTLPLVLPPTVVGFFLLMVFGKNGVLGKFLYEIGLPFIFSLRGAVAAAFVVSFPLVYRAVRSTMEQMDKQMVDAARTLGISESKILFHVILPNCRSGILAGIILAFARGMGEFGATMMVAGNIPQKTQTMALAVYTAVQSGNRQQAYFWSVCIVLLSVVAMTVILLLERKTKIREEDGF